jgi:4-amino-4-deoxy-L-arabinose transferase-like glycosyltransferase
LIAFLNGAAWSIITPPFQGRDEPDHFTYVQQLAETGTLPHRVVSEYNGYSPEVALILQGLDQEEVKFSVQTLAISSTSEQRRLTRDVNAGLSHVGTGEAGLATPEPPLYYAIETVPYAMGEGDTLTQLELMRLTSALIAAITALLAFFFLRELLPGVPWAVTIGAVCVAVQPLFGFMSGTLNPDTMLYAVSAALLLCLARGFRRGLTRRLAVTIGVLIAVGFMTKLNFVGLAFGVFAGLILLGVREARSRGRQSLLSPAIAAGIGASPVMLYALVNVLSNKPTLGFVSGGLHTFTNGSIFHEISYIWELYLPRLPGMAHYFEGVSTLRDIWFDRSVGLYGWVDTEFPNWVNSIALVPAGAIALLCGRALIAGREALRACLPELAIYVAIGIGVLLMVGVSSYSYRVASGGNEGFADPRYLLPMLPLLGAVLTLAVRGAGRRWAPATGAAIVVLFLAHDVFSQLQAIARYYG